MDELRHGHQLSIPWTRAGRARHYYRRTPCAWFGDAGDDGEFTSSTSRTISGHVDFTCECPRVRLPPARALCQVDATMQGVARHNATLAANANLDIAINKTTFLRSPRGGEGVSRGPSRPMTQCLSRARPARGIQATFSRPSPILSAAAGGCQGNAQGPQNPDSHFDEYRGVVAGARALDGSIKRATTWCMMQAPADTFLPSGDGGSLGDPA